MGDGEPFTESDRIACRANRREKINFELSLGYQSIDTHRIWNLETISVLDLGIYRTSVYCGRNTLFNNVSTDSCAMLK